MYKGFHYVVMVDVVHCYGGSPLLHGWVDVAVRLFPSMVDMSDHGQNHKSVLLIDLR